MDLDIETLFLEFRHVWVAFDRKHPGVTCISPNQVEAHKGLAHRLENIGGTVHDREQTRRRTLNS